MSLVIKHNESFYDSLSRYFTNFIAIIPNVFGLIAVAGFIAVISYTCYYVHERRRCKKFNLIQYKDIKTYTRTLVRQRSIIKHKEMLRNLEFASNKCNEKFYALKCIDIIIYCPQLLNVKSSVEGLTPFHRICFNGCTHLIAFALAKGADPFISTVTGENALSKAVYYFLNNPSNNDFSVLEVLGSTGCQFGDQNKWYNVLLKMAYYQNHKTLVKWLISYQNGSSRRISRCQSTPPTLSNYYKLN